ncbi:MAG: aspartate aminotransferase family protein [Calditrichaeota bacterium]|nr:aspartate aminotransferase family protein [Calditrichota bacterium]
MDSKQFREYAHQVVDWMADYLETIESRPVCSPVEPGEIFAQLPENPPAKGEDFQRIMADLDRVIMPGITHWQHPGFFAYFPANSSPPSVLAEMITATLGAQCMIWQTSPAAAELEERVMSWLGQMIGLPDGFQGVIQDTASTATLAAILTAREKRTGYAANREGLQGQAPLVVYASGETHSSIEKAVKIAGLGRKNLRVIPVDEAFAMQAAALDAAIGADLEAGRQPLCVVATLGTTGSTAMDPLADIAEICRRRKVWLHVDAAYAGSAFLLPEMRHFLKGVEQVDSLVFNPHKWLLTNFDCSAYFVRDPEALVRTFEILPEYLKTVADSAVKNYRDWGIPLGRRFRALKLWFVIRSYGVEGLQAVLRRQMALSRNLRDTMEADGRFEILAPLSLNLLCFRFRPAGMPEGEALDSLNRRLLEELNNTGELYLTHTRLRGQYTLRLVCGQLRTEERHIEQAWAAIRLIAESLQG